MKEDLPLPQAPSTERVSGGWVSEWVRNTATASTFGLKPSVSSRVGWSLTLLGLTLAELSLALDVLVSSSGGAAIYEISNCAADHIAEIGVAKRSFVKLRVLEQLRLTQRCDLDCPETGGTSVL